MEPDLLEKIGNLPGLSDLIKKQHRAKERLRQTFDTWKEYWDWYIVANEIALGEMPKDRNPLNPDGSRNANYNPLLDPVVNVFLVRESDMQGRPSWYMPKTSAAMAQGIMVNFLDRVYDRTIRQMRLRMIETQGRGALVAAPQEFGSDGK
jgi:hypothetical protein